jgi:hypothetical protein
MWRRPWCTTEAMLTTKDSHTGLADDACAWAFAAAPRPFTKARTHPATTDSMFWIVHGTFPWLPEQRCRADSPCPLGRCQAANGLRPLAVAQRGAQTSILHPRASRIDKRCCYCCCCCSCCCYFCCKFRLAQLGRGSIPYLGLEHMHMEVLLCAFGLTVGRARSGFGMLVLRKVVCHPRVHARVDDLCSLLSVAN